MDKGLKVQRSGSWQHSQDQWVWHGSAWVQLLPPVAVTPGMCWAIPLNGQSSVGQKWDGTFYQFAPSRMRWYKVNANWDIYDSNCPNFFCDGWAGKPSGRNAPPHQFVEYLIGPFPQDPLF